MAGNTNIVTIQYIARVIINIYNTCMNTKLTLTLKKEIIEQAKKYAAEKGRSLSEMVENYFKYLTELKIEEKTDTLSPRVKKLRGIVKVKPGFDYKEILDEERFKKYGL